MELRRGSGMASRAIKCVFRNAPVHGGESRWIKFNFE